jgi:hypothetical protein
MSYTIYFNEKEHKYTNEVGNAFISATTLIGKYEYKFSDKQNQRLLLIYRQLIDNAVKPCFSAIALRDQLQQIADRWITH